MKFIQKSLFAVLFFGFANISFAQKTISPPMPTLSPDKIEVVEFFSYACPHCNDLHPIISKWIEKLPNDVSFRRVAIPGRAFYTLMSKAYYTLEALGEVKRLDNAVFSAVHKSGGPAFNDEASFAKWAGSQGLDEKKVLETMKSFGVDAKVKQAAKFSDSAKIEGVPSMIIDGRYHVSNPTSFPDMLAKADTLIEKRRAERKKQ